MKEEKYTVKYVKYLVFHHQWLDKLYLDLKDNFQLGSKELKRMI